jgi:pyruvate/2-oxoglutarate dehydrogenase complex dihydrolipoamide acyltransferase (E2) component
MIYKMTVPSAADDVPQFRVLEWHGAAGSVFQAGDLIVELETHKAVFEVRAGRAAVLREIAVAAGEWCQIGAPLALFSDDAGEALADGGDLGDLAVDFEIA